MTLTVLKFQILPRNADDIPDPKLASLNLNQPDRQHWTFAITFIVIGLSIISHLKMGQITRITLFKLPKPEDQDACIEAYTKMVQEHQKVSRFHIVIKSTSFVILPNFSN